MAALPADAQDRVFPYLKEVSLPLGNVLYEPGDTLRQVCFPTDAIVSLLYVMENGASAEISVVGNEGLIGTAVFMGGESTPSRAIVQSPGTGFSLPAQRLKNEFNEHSEMRMLMLRYTPALITQMAQTALQVAGHEKKWEIGDGKLDTQILRCRLFHIHFHITLASAFTAAARRSMRGKARHAMLNIVMSS